MAKIDGKLVDFFISTAVPPAAPVWNRIVCSTDLSLDGTKDTTSVTTKCGTQKATGAANWVISGGFQAESAPSANQYSYDELVALFQDGTPVAWKMEHLTDATIVHRSGLGELTAYAESYGAEENGSGTFTLDVDGDITTVSA